MKLEFTPVDYDYFDFEGRNYALLFGRDSKGKRIAVIDSCPVYFWAILEDGIKKEKINSLIEKIGKIKLNAKGRKTRVEKVELHEKNFLGKKVKALKIFATNYKDLHDIADKLGMKEITQRRGYDLGYITHYIIEKKILPLHWYEIEGDICLGTGVEEFGGIASALECDICLKLTSAKEIKHKDFNPKALAYDIETDELGIGEGEILMISLVTDNFKKVITWKPHYKKQEFVEKVKDEAELLERFVHYVKKLSPDFLVGYFSDGFDLPYLKARAEKLNVKLSLGIDGSQPRFSGGINPSGKIRGIVHIDLIKFIKTAYSQYMQSETLSLNEVAKEFLGDEKVNFQHKKSNKGVSWERYYEYNLQDSALTFRLFKKMWHDLLEFTRVMQEPIFEVSRNGMSKNVESYILHNLDRFNEIPEKRPTHNELAERRHREKYKGGFVLEPVPGLYENIVLFDFTSSYGSIIVTYNLSKATFLGINVSNTRDAYCIETEKGKLCFSKKRGFFPEMLKELIEKRKQYKEELKKKPDAIKRARSNAFKLLVNSSYGYQGFFGARYYCPEAAAAAAAFARKSIKDAIEKTNKHGFKVIYADTDGFAFLRGKHTKKDVLNFLKKLNSEMPGIMELELEGFFKRGLWVTTRAGTVGAKKKYALIDEHGKLRIRGFETVRRDWCNLAREVQSRIIKQILEDGDEKRALEYVREVIKKIKQRKVNREDLIIRTQLKKPLSEYKAVSPHVVAAKKMQEQKIPVREGNLIEYYIAEMPSKAASKLVREKVKLPHEEGDYNIEYYLENQILPAVENIFQVFGIEVSQIIKSKRQTTLADF